MHEILSAFGIDWRLIAIQIFNFAILAGALTYFLYGPILRILEKRRETIAQGVADAAAAGERLKAAESEKTEIVGAAHKEAANVALRAKEHAETTTAALLREAEEKRARMIEDAAKEGEVLKNRLYKESEAEIAKSALLAAEKILKEKG